MEEFGKALVVEPWLGTVVIGGGLLKRAGGAPAQELIAGTRSSATSSRATC